MFLIGSLPLQQRSVRIHWKKTAPWDVEQFVHGIRDYLTLSFCAPGLIFKADYGTISLNQAQSCSLSALFDVEVLRGT